MLSNLIGKVAEITSIRRTGEIVMIAPGKDGAPIFYVKMADGKLEVTTYSHIRFS